MEHMQDLATQNPDRQKEMAKKLEEGKLSIRDWREQIQNVMNLYVALYFVIFKPNTVSRGPISKIASMIPGLSQDLLQGSDEEGALRMKRMIYITDSMSSTELDSDGSPFMESTKDGKPIGLTWRVTRVARGSGTTVREVEELLCQYRMMANMAKQAGGKNGWLQAMQKIQGATGGRGRGAGGMPTPAQIQAMQVREYLISPGTFADINSTILISEFTPPWHASTDATTNEKWGWNPGNDENFNAKPGW
jgi:signal recognition particle subunit SRP54